MDGDCLGPMFGHALFQLLQALFQRLQELRSQLPCLRANLCFRNDENSYLINFWAQKVSTLWSRSQQGRQSRGGRQLSAVDKALLPCCNELSGSRMCWCCVGRELSMIFCHECKKFRHRFPMIERISKQRLFATYHNDVGVRIKSWDSPRELAVRLCATFLQKWLFTPWRGRVTQ